MQSGIKFKSFSSKSRALFILPTNFNLLSHICESLMTSIGPFPRKTHIHKFLYNIKGFITVHFRLPASPDSSN